MTFFLRAASIGLVLAVGCGEAERAAAPTPPEREAPITETRAVEAPAPEPVPPEPPAPGPPPLVGLEALDEPDPLEPPVGAGAAPIVVIVPEGPTTFGCVATSAPIRVLDAPGRLAIAAAGSGFVVAGYVHTGGDEAVAIARVTAGGPGAIFATLPIDRPVAAAARRAPPALAVASDGRLLIAATNADGAVLFGDLELTSAATADTLALLVPGAHADGRFAPAIVPTEGAVAVAWTDGSGTPMRVRLARVDRTGALLGELMEVTPEAGGAAAPTSGRGTASPTLFFVDPRVSISVVSRVMLEADATPGPTEVVRPLARAADPASFVVVGDGSAARIAYVAVGSAGSRAVGLLRATGSEPPVPVVPGLGYGEPINVDAAALGGGAVLVAEAPSAAAPDAAHEVRVRALDAAGTLSEPVVLGAATDPSIAASENGDVLVTTAGGYVTRLRCRVD